MQLWMDDPSESYSRPRGPVITLRMIGSAIGAHKWLVVLAVLIGGVLAYGFGKMIPQRYAAEVALISDASLSGIIDQRMGEPLPQTDPSATETVVETIGSNIVLRRGLAALSPEVLAALREEGEIEAQLAEITDSPITDPAELEIALLSRHVARGLEINNSGRSYTIYVRYRSADPIVSAAVANALANAYLDYRSELKRSGYANSLANLDRELATLKGELQEAERRAQSMREQMKLLDKRSEALTGRQQEDAIAQSAELFSRQREAEREAEAAASVYERLLLNQREIQSRIDAPELHVYLFAPAVVPTRPSGFNVKPVLLLLGLLAGFLAGTSLALLRSKKAMRHAEPALDPHMPASLEPRLRNGNGAELPARARHDPREPDPLDRRAQ